MKFLPTRPLGLCLLSVLLLAACAPLPPSPTGTPSLPTATGTSGPTPTLTPTPLPPIEVDPALLRGLSIQVWEAFSGPAYEVFASQVGQFNAVNEWGIVVTESGYGDYTTLLEAVNAAINAEPRPDLVAALPEQTLAWQAAGQVVDLVPYIRDPDWGLVDEVSADIPPIFWAQDNLNGEQLGLPAQRSARFLFYNKTWAHELGFNHAPETADEFRQQACAANASFRADTDLQNDGYGGWVVDAAWQTSYAWLLAFGGGALDGDEYRFRSDQNLAALEFLKGLYDDHCAWLSIEPAPFTSFARRTALFVSGDLAEVPLAGAAMSAAANPDEWTLLPLPGDPGSGLVTYGPSYSLLKSTPERQLAAWLFARWLLSPENQSQWVEATGLLPLRNAALELIGPYRLASLQWETAVSYLPLAQGVPQLASWRKVRYVLEDGVTVLFQTNTPVEQIPVLLAEMDTMAEDFNDECRMSNDECRMSNDECRMMNAECGIMDK